MQEPTVNLFASERLSTEEPAASYPDLEDYPTESIAGLTFCLWTEPPRKVRFAPTARFALLTLAAEALILGGSLGFIRFIFINPDLGGALLRIGAIATMVICYGSVIGGTLLLRRIKPTATEIRPIDIPRTAVPVRIIARSYDASLGTTNGWMWIDRNWLCFRGKSFGFRLQASDFKSNVNPSSLTGALRLNLPKPFPSTSVWIFRRLMKTDQFEKWTFKEQLGDQLSAWRDAAQTTETRLYPPIRGNSLTVRILPSLAGWTAIGLGMGALLATFFTLLPEDIRPKGNPITASMAMGLFLPMMFGLGVFSEVVKRTSREGELRKAAQSVNSE